MKYVYLALLVVILVGSLSLSSCRLAYRAGQESNSHPDASNTQPGGATANQPPQARIISISPNEATQGDTVSFKGQATDADGTVKTYFWQSNIDGIISRVESFDFNMLSAGTHTISFMVVDNLGAKSEVVTSGVVINTPNASHSGSSSNGADLNKPPKAFIQSVSDDLAKPGDTIYFDGIGTDADGTVVAYRWRSSIDGTLSNLASFSTNELSEGRHIIYFLVIDNNGAQSDEIQYQVDINARR